MSNEEKFREIFPKVSYLVYRSFYLLQRNTRLLFCLISALPWYWIGTHKILGLQKPRTYGTNKPVFLNYHAYLILEREGSLDLACFSTTSGMRVGFCSFFLFASKILSSSEYFSLKLVCIWEFFWGDSCDIWTMFDFKFLKVLSEGF